MDGALTPDIYSPSINDIGDYTDNVSLFNFTPSSLGIYCDCNGRGVLYKTRAKFIKHIECKKHTEWIKALNNNKHNYYRQCQESQKMIEMNKRLIAEYENKLSMKDIIINALTEKLLLMEGVGNVNGKENVNLLDF